MVDDESSNVIDINEAFEKILLAEDLAEQTAYEEGFDSGKRQMLEGYHLGYHRASSLAAELGYYLGILLYVQKFVNIEKISLQTVDLLQQIQTFPFHNDDNFDIIARFESIKLQVKKICSLAKIDPKYLQKNLWDKCLPSEIMSYVKETGPDVLNEVQKFDISSSSDQETELHVFLKNVTSLQLENCDDAINRSEFFKIINCKQEINALQPLKSTYMKIKKYHEVDIFTKTIMWLIRNQSSIILDAGAGKGYSSVHLANHYNLPVLAIESSQVNHNSALNHCDLVNRKNKVSKSLICYEMEEINENTDFLKIVKKHFPNLHKKQSLAIVALHGCGSLSDFVIKAFLKIDDIKHLCVVPCCYHFSSKSLGNTYEFSKNSRMLAQQSRERMKEKSNELSPSLFYRAVLQVILQNLGINNYKVGRGAPSSSFLTYVKWVLNKIGASKELSDKFIEDTYKDYKIHKWKFDFFQLLRIHVAPIVEAAILLDKCLFLQRSKIFTDLRIVQLFDPLISPRSWAIIAIK